MTLLLLAAAAAFALAAAGWVLVPGLLRSADLVLRAPILLGGAWAAALATSHATGWPAADLAWRVILGGGAAWLAAYASPLVLAVVLMPLALAAGGEWALAAAVVAGAQLASAAAGSRSPLLGAMSGAVAASAALRLDPADPAALAAATAAVAIAALTAAGLIGLRRSDRRRAASIARVAALAAVALVGIGALSAVMARPHLEEGVRLADSALSRARAGDSAGSESDLRAASGAFRSGRRSLDAWWALPARVLPVLGVNLEVATTMAGSGQDLASVGANAIGRADIDEIRLVDGAVPIERLVALRQPVRRSMVALTKADGELTGASRTWLAPPLARRFDQLTRKVATAREDATVAAQATEVLPAMLGAEGPRRYFLAVVTPAELRGSGGIIGNFGEITVEGGKLRLTRLGRSRELTQGGDPNRTLTGPPEYLGRYADFVPQRFWQNATLSPDFPTVAGVIAELYPKSGGQPIDGVISVDPITLARLLRLIGPVDVPNLPEPLTAENAEEELLFQQYVRFPNEERLDFLGDASLRIWERFTSGSLPGPRQLAEVFGPVVAGRHLQIASVHPHEQALLDRVGLTGRVQPVEGDFLGVVTQNTSGNKIDWFLDRSYSYDVKLDPATGELEAVLHLRLTNRSPARGLPPIIIGPYPGIDTVPGLNRLLLSIYSPWGVEEATVQGQPLLLQTELELDRLVHSSFIDIPSGTTADITITFRGEYPETARYRLDLLRQPTLRPDDVTTALTVDGGWRISALSGALKASGARAETAGPLNRPRRVEVLLSR